MAAVKTARGSGGLKRTPLARRTGPAARVTFPLSGDVRRPILIFHFHVAARSGHTVWPADSRAGGEGAASALVVIGRKV